MIPKSCDIPVKRFMLFFFLFLWHCTEIKRCLITCDAQPLIYFYTTQYLHFYHHTDQHFLFLDLDDDHSPRMKQPYLLISPTAPVSKTWTHSSSFASNMNSGPHYPLAQPGHSSSAIPPVQAAAPSAGNSNPIQKKASLTN